MDYFIWLVRFHASDPPAGANANNLPTAFYDRHWKAVGENRFGRGAIFIGGAMVAERTLRRSLEELMVSTLAMTDARVKLLIAEGVFTDEEFKAQLCIERALC
jgi:hypothetical protein